jgi:anthranilate synthase component I
MYYPDFEEFVILGKKSKMVPVSLEMEGDLDTPITLYKKLCKDKNSYLLESVEGGNKWARYSFIGRNPFMTIKSYGNQVVIQKGNEVIHREGKVLEILKDLMKGYSAVPIDSMPDFTGGAVGYMGYDVIRQYETLENINVDDINMPEVHFLMTEEVIVYDHLKQKIKIIVNVPIEDHLKSLYDKALERLQMIKKEIMNNSMAAEESKLNAQPVTYSSNETKEAFMNKVLKAKEYIRNGDIFQVVLSQRFEIETGVSPFKAYRALRSLNPSPYMFYLNFGEYQLVGSSPELLVKLKEGRVETCPIAGTRPRGKTIEEDELYAEELLKDEKELAEHLMLVDLARNDIGKISKFGTVEVNQFMEIHRYSHVMHIVSNVIGALNENYDMYDSLVACLPAGTLSGAPKIRAMEIIDELENKKRGIYGGAVGYFGFNGNMDTCITIRTLLFKDKKAYIQAGAGIVADSNPESEYDETLRKAKALMETVRKVEEETA